MTLPSSTGAAGFKTPDDWSREFNLQVLDPDGWRIDGLPWDEPITEAEFLWRVASSTIRSWAYPGTEWQ